MPELLTESKFVFDVFQVYELNRKGIISWTSHTITTLPLDTTLACTTYLQIWDME